MAVLFLDIDGVLNRDGTEEKFMDTDGLDKVLLERFLTWQETQPHVNIVLSSDWRTSEPHKKYLRTHGLLFIDETPILGIDRGFEITRWILDHPKVKTWAVLDDCQMKCVGKRLVQTSPKRGVEMKHLTKLTILLKEDGKTP